MKRRKGRVRATNRPTDHPTDRPTDATTNGATDRPTDICDEAQETVSQRHLCADEGCEALTVDVGKNRCTTVVGGSEAPSCCA